METGRCARTLRLRAFDRLLAGNRFASERGCRRRLDLALARPVLPGERALARRVAEARATIPDLELSVEVDVSDEIPGTPRLIQACARALREIPRANGAYRDGRFELYTRINVGVVIARDDGNVIPTVFDADTKALPELSAELASLGARADEGALTAPALAGATFTLWNAGELGVEPCERCPNPLRIARYTELLREGNVVNVARLPLARGGLYARLWAHQSGGFLGESAHPAVPRSVEPEEVE